MLIERRNKIGQVYFSRINPLIRFALTDAGILTFENPSVRAQFARAPEQGYEGTWYRFDNATKQAEPLGPPTTTLEERLQSPAALPSGVDAFVKISIRGLQPVHPAWARPIDVYFRRTGAGWRLVCLDRLPAGS